MKEGIVGLLVFAGWACISYFSKRGRNRTFLGHSTENQLIQNPNRLNVLFRRGMGFSRLGFLLGLMIYGGVGIINISAQTVQTFNTPGSQTFLVPAGVTSLSVDVWGGGGGGGGTSSGNANKGGGGGGGGYRVNNNISVTPGETLTIEVGAGGTVGIFQNGGMGGVSRVRRGVTTLITVNGGAGGIANGDGGTGAAGDISGGNGGDGWVGGGGVSGAGGNGGNGGNGGASIPVATHANGNPGQAPGGGGGGSRSTGDLGARTGGLGANGRVRISYIPPPPYKAEFISADLGSSSWCSGETRNVTITIRNIGTAAWTNTSPDINIGVRWSSYADYYSRVDANNHPPGEVRTYSLPLTASTSGGTPFPAGSPYVINFDVVNEGAFWFRNSDGAGGPGNPEFISVAQTIVQKPDVLDISTVACSESAFSVTPINGTIPAGTTYSWSAPVVSGGVTGGAAGSGASITGTLYNSTNIAQSAIYTVTPIIGSCEGTPFTVTVLLHPTAAITPIDISSCSDGSFSVTPANGTNGIVPASTTYSWQAPTVTGGVTGGSGGSGTSISGTLTNPTDTLQTATYTVTPITGSCVGIPFPVTVTVNPKPALTAISSTACNNESFTITPAHGTNGLVPTGTSYSWSAPTVTGTMTGGTAGSGANITGALFNPTNTSQTATYTVTPIAGTCTGTPFSVTVAVNPSPVIPSQTETVCSGSAFTVSPANGSPTTATIVPAGTTYTWTVADNANVTGESDQGTAQANISQTLTNITNVPQRVTYNVTPTSGAAGNCVGNPFTVTVTVNPSPEIPAQTAEVCSGSAFTVSPSQSGSTIVPAGTTYTWTVADNANVTGESDQGTAQANISQTLTNTTNVAQTVIYTVTPTSGAVENCAGNPFTVTVTVNPSPVIPPHTLEICSGSEFTVSPSNGGATIVPAGTSYTWTVADNPNVTGESNQVTAQPNISQTLTNITNVAQTVVYTITPVSGTCSDASFTVNVTVNPGMDIAPMTDTICSDDTFTVIPANGSNGLIPSGTTYSWSAPSVTGELTGGSAGSGTSITGTLSNPGNATQTATYTVTPSVGSCSGTPFTINVTVNPKATISSINTQVCTDGLFTVSPVNGTNGVVPAGTIYTWTTPSVNGGITGGASGSGASIIGTLTNPTNIPQTATYTVTPLSGSCTGASFTMIVTVNPVTAIDTHPSQTDFEVCFGDGFEPISVVATGSANLTYQWYRNTSPINSGGTPVSGATSTSFSPPSTPVGVNYYYVEVTGACGIEVSEISGKYEVFPPVTEITSDLDNTPQTICPGDSFSEIFVIATGANLTYQWYSSTSPSNSGGTLLPGANDSAFTPPSDTFGPVYYYAVASSDCGTIPSSVSGAFAVTNATSAEPDQTVCVNEPLDPVIIHTTTGTTGVGTPTGLPPGITATWSNNVITLSGTPTTASGSPFNYSIPLTGACGTQVATGTITVSPKSVINPLTTQVCTGGSFSVTPVNGTDGVIVPGTIYSWSTPSETAGVTGGSAGSGNSISDTLTNSTATPQTATYTVTPVSGSCIGSTFTVTVTVNPRPTLSSPITMSRCSDTSTTYTATSDTPGTTFSWTRATVAEISNAAGSGSTATATETLINTTAYPINVTYVYTLTANGCSNTQNVTVTVNPTPMLSSTLTPVAVCNNSAFTYTPTSTTSGAIFTWTRASIAGINNPAVTVPQSTNPNETLVNTTSNPIDVVYSYTITANGCTNTQNVTVRVNPTPTLSSTLTPAAICSNSAFTYNPISATIGATFRWTRAAVSGISNAAVTTPQNSNPNEILVNNTASPIDVVYAYTITANGCSNAQNVTVRVNPRPSIIPTPITTAICSGDTFSVIPVNGINGIVPTGITYTWTRGDNTNVSGDTNQPSPQSVISQTLTNNTNSIQTVTYTVTPISGGCTGPTFQVVATVNPTPAVNPVTSPPAVCAGSPVAGINFGGSAVAGTVYNWTNDNPSIGLAPSGTGAIPSFTATNTGVTPVTANITVTPVANGCAGPSRTFTITVNPTPKVTIVTDYCVVGGRVQLVANSNVPGTTWLWNTGQTTSSILVDLSGTYYVTATTPSPSNCTTSASIGVAQELVVDGSFTDFDPNNLTFNTGYLYTADVPGQLELYPEGLYSVGTNANNYHNNFWGTQDHTNNSIGPRNMMITNGFPGNSNVTIWEQDVIVEPNTEYYFSAWAMSLNAVSPYAKLRFEVNGVQVGTTANLPAGTSNNSNNGWVRFYSNPVWNSGSVSGQITIRIVNLETAAGGNDFALDDISFGHLSTFIILTSGVGTDNQTVCQDSPIEDITYDVGSGILGPEVTGLPPGITSIWNGVTLRFSGSPTEAGTFPYTITTTGNCLPSIASGTITVRSTPTAGAIGASQTVCSGEDPIAFTSTTAGTGDGVISYRWESNKNLSSPIWEEVAGAPTGATYDPPVLSGTTQYRRITLATLNELTCESEPTAPIQVTVQNPPTPGSIAGDQTICNGDDPTTFTSTVAGTGDGTITYRWESSVSDFTSWEPVMGANSAIYDAPAGLPETTRFRRITISSLNGKECESTPTAPIEVLVSEVPTAGSIAADQEICEGEDPVIFNSTTDGTGSGSIFYIWESAVSPFTDWSEISGANLATYDAPTGLSITTQYRRTTVSIFNGTTCKSVPTSSVQVSIKPEITVTPVDPDPTLCLNEVSPIIITHTTTGATGIVPQSASINYNLPNGVIPNWTTGTLTGEGVLTISGNPTEQGIFNYTIPLEGCGSAAAIGTITVTNPSYPITTIEVVNPTSLPGSSSFTVFSPGMTPGTYWIEYSTNGVNGGANWEQIMVEVTTSGQFTFSSPTYANEGTTLLTINSIQEITDLCPYYPPNNNTAVYGFGCSTEFLHSDGDDAFYVPADVYEVRIEAHGNGSLSDSRSLAVTPGGIINIGIDGNNIFATQAPLATATPADWLISSTTPDARLVFLFDCSPAEPNCPGLPPYEYIDADGFTVLRFDVGACEWHAPDGLDEFEVLIVGGGGGGGFGNAAGGGGGGGVLYQRYEGITMNGLPGLQNAVFPLSVGINGMGATTGAQGGNGQESTFTLPVPGFEYSGGNSFTDLVASGGGGGGSTSNDPSIRQGAIGASGGGGAALGIDESTGGVGSTGSRGGNGYGEASGSGGGGGGGDSAIGEAANYSGVMIGGSGGSGSEHDISGEVIFYGAGGGGTSSGATTNQAGSGGNPYGAGYFAGGSGTNHGVGQSPTTYGSGGGAGRLGGGAGFPGVIYIRYPSFRILPVEYLYFNAQYEPDQRAGKLTWATAKEWENERFEIERTVNNVREWETIGQKPGAGNSESPVEYDYTDNHLPAAGGNIFYRLKQIDLDGDSTYSETRAIKVEPLKGFSYWKVYPNPTTGDPINLEILNSGAYNDEKVTIRLISTTGVFDIIEGKSPTQLSVQLSNILRTKPAGIYTVEISWATFNEYHKVILRR